jgi:hypothetical protein
VAASLAAACLAIPAAPAKAGGAPAAGRIAFSDFVTNQIYAVNPDGTALAQLTHEPSGVAARWPGWSPGGSRILFVRFNLATGMGRIWIMKADGAGQHRLASDAPGYRDYQPRYSPDGRHIVFTRCSPGDGLCAIWIMRSDGTHRRLVIPFIEAPNETNNFDPAISPHYLCPVRIPRGHLAGLGRPHQRQAGAPADCSAAGSKPAELVTGRQPYHVHQQFRPAALQRLRDASQWHPSHEARHITVAG